MTGSGFTFLPRRLRLLVSRAAWVGAAVVAGWLTFFHAALLYQRFADESIARPGILLRWIVSLLLIGGAVRAIHYARAHRRERQVVFVLALLVLLVHIGLPADQRILTGGGQLVVVLQTAFAAVPAALLLLALLVVAPTSTVIASDSAVDVPRAHIVLFASSPPLRSPPLF